MVEFIHKLITRMIKSVQENKYKVNTYTTSMINCHKKMIVLSLSIDFKTGHVQNPPSQTREPLTDQG